MADEEETPAEAVAVEGVQMSVLDALKEVCLWIVIGCFYIEMSSRVFARSKLSSDHVILFQ